MVSAVLLACAPLSAGGCPPPVPAQASAQFGDGGPVVLRWPASPPGSRVEVWAQWRVPEGEVLRTVELAIAGEDRVDLPASPARGRPLKLSVELVRHCPDGGRSERVVWWQAQFDPTAACPAVEGLQVEPGPAGLAWLGEPLQQLEIEFLQPGRAAPLARLAPSGRRVAWPAAVQRPVVVSATRLCAEGRRSLPTLLAVP